MLIQEAMTNGASLEGSCKTAEISMRTYQRWKSGNTKDKRKGAEKHIPGKITEKEKQEIIDLCCSNEYKDSNPYDIYISLLDKKKYLASISTIYRVLKSSELLFHRSNKRQSKRKSSPGELIAVGPNQVWSWDITWLKSRVKGIFFFAYMIIDIWDKSIIGWDIHEQESEDHAKDLFERTLREEKYPQVSIHSDNGNPMKGISLLSLFYDLGIKNSFSRPRVSNDNPFIESFFGTMKTSVKYPGKFDSIHDARIWMADFVYWYNNHHRHSGNQYFTPSQMRDGSFIDLAESRNRTIFEAYKTKPERWSRKPRQWITSQTVVLNPSLNTQQMNRNAA